MNTVDQLKQAARRLSGACDEAIPGLEASGAVAHATNPLDYAWAHHEQFISWSTEFGWSLFTFMSWTAR